MSGSRNIGVLVVSCYYVMCLKYSIGSVYAKVSVPVAVYIVAACQADPAWVKQV